MGEHGVGRVIARPFIGTAPNFTRTANRHDFSLLPPKDTMLDALVKAGYDTYGVGKSMIFLQDKESSIHSVSRIMWTEWKKPSRTQDVDFNGICFVNLVDFDMVYGHRNNRKGYAEAATTFDRQLGTFMERMRDDDILMITADHGCDPGFPGTDHTREHTPFLVYGKSIREDVNLGTRESFADIAATILDIFNVENNTDGTSMKEYILKK